ncbi:MAG: hypothetical protein II821_00135 [Treponema sp.]|nr:hypothetical protein [Treponema sp.]
MQYLDKLKKERSIDRVIFLAGMVLVFIGFLIPTIYVKQIVVKSDLTVAEPAEAVEVAESAESELDAVSETEELDAEASEEGESTEETAESEESEALAVEEESEEDDADRAFVHFASKKEVTKDFKKLFKKDVYGNYELDPLTGEPKFELILDKDGNKIPATTTTYKYVVVDAEVEENDDGEQSFILENGKPKLTYVLDFDKDGNKIPDGEVIHVKPEDLEKDYTIETNHFNLFGAVKVLNQSGLDYGDFDYIPGTAYNATFLVIVWLASIAGIILFFCAKSIIGDIVVTLIAIAFGLTATFTIPLTLSVAPIIGYYTVGGYFVLAGILVALVGSILGAAHIKHPSIAKSE